MKLLIQTGVRSYVGITGSYRVCMRAKVRYDDPRTEHITYLQRSLKFKILPLFPVVHTTL